MRLLIFTISIAFSLYASAKDQNEKKVLTSNELLAGSQPSDWRSVDPGHLLYLEIPSGRVIIELAPDFAPEHVARIISLAREKYWNGLAIVRVQDNYVVQWADPNAEKAELKRKFKDAQRILLPELDVALAPRIEFTRLVDHDVYAPEVGFSNGFATGRDSKTKRMWLLHCYGAVGVGRDIAINSGDGTELYAVIGNAPRHLDRNVTLVGRVLQGMELFSTLPRGHGALGFYEKPEQNIVIRSVQVAADVPESDRTEVEVLRTDTPLFKKWIEAKRNRTEDWFHYKAGHIDACNIAVPTRVKTQKK